MDKFFEGNQNDNMNVNMLCKEEVDQNFINAVCQEVMKMFKGKVFMDDYSGVINSSVNFTGIFIYFSVVLVCLNKDNIRKFDQIIDTGVSDYMIFYFDFFILSKYFVKFINIILSDGIIKFFMFVGQIY